MTSEYEPNESGEAAPTDSAPMPPTEETSSGNGWGVPEPPGDADRHASWMEQLQSMIDGVARQSRPALRELAAKAAELAAKAGDAAGPVAHRAAEVTGDVGQKVASKGRELATELRRSNSSGGTGTAVAEAPTEAPPEAEFGDGPARGPIDVPPGTDEPTA